MRGVKTVVRLLVGTLLGGLFGTIAGFGYLATERCSGPACAGLIVIPIGTGCGGLVAGLFGTLAFTFFRPKPMPRAFVEELERKRG
jgi:hypothetical protein